MRPTTKRESTVARDRAPGCENRRRSDANLCRATQDREVPRACQEAPQRLRLNRRWVTQQYVIHLCGVYVSLTLAMPWACFYTHSLYWDISSTPSPDKCRQIRLSQQSILDLITCPRLAGLELSGRSKVPPDPTAATHTDAAVVGCG